MAVVSNYPIFDEKSGRSAVVVDLFKGLGPLYEFAEEHADNPHGALAVVTEIGQIMPARMWQQTTTFRFLGELAQSRKRRLHLHWDAQVLSGVDKLIRENTHKVRVCRVVLYHPWRKDLGAADEVDFPGKPRVPWLMRRETLYPEDAQLSDETRSKRRLDREFHWFSREWARAYDTRHIVRADAEPAPEGPATNAATSAGERGLALPAGSTASILARNVQGDAGRDGAGQEPPEPVGGS
jgi:hypothetical protein